MEQINKEVQKLEENLEFSNRAIDTINDKVDDLEDKTIDSVFKRPKPLNPGKIILTGCFL